MEILTRSTDYK